MNDLRAFLLLESTEYSSKEDACLPQPGNTRLEHVCKISPPHLELMVDRNKVELTVLAMSGLLN